MIANRLTFRNNFFNKKNMAYLATCARLAYLDEPDLEASLSSEGFDLTGQNVFFENKKTDTQGFIVADRRNIIISFRGSENNLTDWLNNFNFFRDPWTNTRPIGQVHQGFCGALDSVWNTIEERLTSLRDNNQRIWLTGHSLGGALATLAAATLTFQGQVRSVAAVYTFGQPRVGNHEFSRKFNQALKGRTFRIVNNNDVVSRVPTQIMGYSHVGCLKYFDHRGKLANDKNLSWWARFWDRVEGRVEHVFDVVKGISELKFIGTDGIDDHEMPDYERQAYIAARLLPPPR